MPVNGTRPSARGPEFRAYFEAVVKSSKNLPEAMERMGYSAPTSVWYHLKKFGIETPDHWYPRPSARGPEFASHFEDVVKASKTVGEAVRRLGYANPSIIYHHLKRLGVEAPLQWRLKPYDSLMRQEHVPAVIVQNDVDRAWSGGLVQGEGAVVAHYSKRVDATGLDVRVAMTDPDPVLRLCDLFGVARPSKPLPSHQPRHKPKWECVAGGLRAYRILQEILPFLYGGKKKDAERALEFFAPGGYRQGQFGGYDIWPRDRFPFRKPGNVSNHSPRGPDAKEG